MNSPFRPTPGSSDCTFNLASDSRITMPSTGQVIPVQFQRHGGNGAHPMQAMNGSSSAAAINAVLSNDSLAGMTAKQIFFDCVWLSEESTTTKIMLLCIGRFFDDNARSSSMSYAQVARECGLHEVTAKKTANAVKDRWLRIGVGKGFYVPGKGAQNLYHGISPPELVERLREERRKGRAVPRDAEIEKAVDAAAERVKTGVVSDCTGVASDYPEPQSGVVSGYPEGDRGSPGLRPGLPRTTRTQIYSEEEKTLSGADAPGADATQDLFTGGVPDQGGAPSDRPLTSKRGAPCKPAPSTADIKLAFDLYLETAGRCGLAKPKKVEPWAPNIRARLRESGIDGWKEVLAKVEASPFLRGEKTTFRADLDWLTRPKNFAKVMSGKYDEAAAPKPKPKMPTRYGA